MSNTNPSEDKRSMPERLWIRQGGYDVFLATPDKPVTPGAVEYMRVLTRQEVDKQAAAEGTDVQQMLNANSNTIRRQRERIAKLEKVVQGLCDSGAPLQGDEVARG